MSVNMDMVTGKNKEYETVKNDSTVSHEILRNQKVTDNNNLSDKDTDKKGLGVQGKEPSISTIESAISEMNSKIDMHRTRCEYAYDEPTKRISIKIYDKDTDDLIREVPAEETLKMLQKVWELAGIIVDEKM